MIELKRHLHAAVRLSIADGWSGEGLTDRNDFGFGLLVESVLQDLCQPGLALGHPGAVVLAYHLLGIAKQLGNVTFRHARLLQEDAGESMPEAMGRGFLFPWPAQVPETIELAPPDIGYHIDVGRPVSAENQRTMNAGTGPNARLQPVGNPCVNLSSGLGRADMALAVAEQAINMKRRHIRYAQAGIHRNRDKIRKIVASCFVPVIYGFAQGWPVVNVAGPADGPLAVLSFAGVEHALQLFVAEGYALFRVLSLALVFTALTGLAGLAAIQPLATAKAKKALTISMYFDALLGATPHEVRNPRTSMVVH
jgi:hypothetical protein